MNKLTKLLMVRMTSEQRELLKIISSKSGMAESEYIRNKIFGIEVSKIQTIDIDYRKTSAKKISITLPEFLLEAVSEKSEKKGLARSRYISAIIQSHFLDFPVFTDMEIDALNRCDYSLEKIGVNINQLTKHFNTTHKQFDPEKHDVFLSLSREIKDVKNVIFDLVSASSGSWGRRHGTHRN